jgi:Holliday junction DNA helicase RuvB
MTLTRPRTLSSYIGQDALKPILSHEITQAKAGRTLPHMLLHGPAGLGKTSLASVIANEAGYTFVATGEASTLTPSALYRWLLQLPTPCYDRAGHRTSPQAPVYLIFIDEIHTLPSPEALYEAMEDCQISDRGRVSWLPDFCLIGATTDRYKLKKPLIDRFGLEFRLESYTLTQLQQIIKNAYPSLSLSEVQGVAARSRGTARVALKYGGRVADHGLGFFDAQGIDEIGLTQLDHRYLECLRFGTVALNTLSSRLGMSPQDIQKEVEPYLLSLGMIAITGRGRELAVVGRGGKGLSAEREIPAFR